MRTAKISVDNEKLIIETPYDEEFIYDLKQIVPKAKRKYDPDMRYWIVDDLSLEDDISELIRDYFESSGDLR